MWQVSLQWLTKFTTLLLKSHFFFYSASHCSLTQFRLNTYIGWCLRYCYHYGLRHHQNGRRQARSISRVSFKEFGRMQKSEFIKYNNLIYTLLPKVRDKNKINTFFRRYSWLSPMELKTRWKSIKWWCDLEKQPPLWYGGAWRPMVLVGWRKSKDEWRQSLILRFCVVISLPLLETWVKRGPTKLL